MEGVNAISRLVLSVTIFFNTGVVLGAGSLETQLISPGQKLEYSRLKWSEIDSDTILFQYFLPTHVHPQLYSEINRSHVWHNFGFAPVSFKTEFETLYSDEDNSFREIISGTVKIKLSEKLSFQYNYELDSDGFDDADFRGIQPEAFGDWTAYLRQGLLVWRSDGAHFIAGRGNLFTSIFGNSILLNSNNPPEDYIWYQKKNGSLVFDWTVISLNPTEGYQRFFSIHRYGIQKKYLCFGFSEVVMARYNVLGAQEFRYLLPATFFYETEVNGGKNTNILWSFDVLYKIKQYSLIGELLIDDFAIDGMTPPKLGFKLGVGRAGETVDWYLEYVRVNRWTGNQFDSQLRLTDNGVLLGHPYGPDSHSLITELYWNPIDWLEISPTFTWIESGSGNIDEWPDYIGASQNFGFSAEPFPSRPISTEYRADLILSSNFTRRFNMDVLLSTSTTRTPSLSMVLRIDI